MCFMWSNLLKFATKLINVKMNGAHDVYSPEGDWTNETIAK